jgi:hypothetical protein
LCVAHGKACCTAHGKALPHGNARPHGNVLGRTATISRTAEGFPHGNDSLTAKKRVPHGKAKQARQSRRRAILPRRTAENALPGLSLPCELCRAASHGKDFAVRIGPFAVWPSRTAKQRSPVVTDGSVLLLLFHFM